MIYKTIIFAHDFNSHQTKRQSPLQLPIDCLKQVWPKRPIPITDQNDLPTKDETIHPNYWPKRLKLPPTGVIFGQVWPFAKQYWRVSAGVATAVQYAKGPRLKRPSRNDTGLKATLSSLLYNASFSVHVHNLLNIVCIWMLPIGGSGTIKCLWPRAILIDSHRIWIYGELTLFIVLIPTPDYPRLYFRLSANLGKLL